MACRLCNEDFQLKRSHIIPEFLYTPLYDEKHRYYRLSSDVKKKNKYYQKGVAEYLLCNDCEQKFSRYESYASHVFRSKSDFSSHLRDRIEGIEYKRFKLFALSILWRAGISNLDEFKYIRLGRHELKLRKMLFDEDPGEEDNYPFIMSIILDEGKPLDGFIIPPEMIKFDGHHYYRFVFGGFAWLFAVSSHRLPNYFVSASINKFGSLRVVESNFNDMGFIKTMAKELSRQEKLVPVKDEKFVATSKK